MSETTTTEETVKTVKEVAAEKSLAKRTTQINRNLTSGRKNQRALGDLLLAVMTSGDLKVLDLTIEDYVKNEFSFDAIAKSHITVLTKYARFTSILEVADIEDASKFAVSVYRSVPADCKPKRLIKAVSSILDDDRKVTAAALKAIFDPAPSKSETEPPEDPEEESEGLDTEGEFSASINRMIMLVTDGYTPNETQIKALAEFSASLTA